MDGSFSSNNQRNPKFKGINNILSPMALNAKMDAKFMLNRGLLDQCRSPLYDTHSSENLDSLDPTLIRYFHTPSPGIIHSAGDSYSLLDGQISRMMLDNQYSKSISLCSRGLSSLSPLSSLENLDLSSRLMSPPIFSTSSKGDDDVLVMDGISVESVPGGRIRMALESGGSSSSSVSPLGNYFYKSEMCRSWEDSGSCRYGPKCQFAHGKEDLRPTRLTLKNKSEVPLCKSYINGSICPYGTKCKFFHPSTNTPDSTTSKVYITSPITVEKQQTSISSRNWSPQDDDIEVTLPSSTAKPPSREDVDAYIDDVLYGPTGKRRLRVFTEFCPTASHPK